MKERPTVEEMKKAFGLDNVPPIIVSSGNDQIDIDEKAGEFREWYEEELREMYEEVFGCDENSRPCTPAESLEKSLIEMRQMREGKKPKRSWQDLLDRIDTTFEEEEK